MAEQELSPWRRAMAMGALILAGEAIFIPAFHPGRYFRTSILEAFAINEIELGEAQAWYGLAAMISYAIGGPLADRVAPRILMTGSLLITAAGSVYMATIPSLLGLKLLFAFWGVSTIFAFWSPLIRTTRELGGVMSQGVAFGVLDGGRGLFAAAIAAFSAWAIGDSLAGATTGAVEDLLLGYAVVTVVVAIVVWFALPRGLTGAADPDERVTSSDVFRLMREPAIWLQALIVLGAYCSYKTFDFYGQFSEDIYGLTKAQSATTTAWLSSLRVFAAITAGVLADKSLGATRTVALGFTMLVVSFSALFLMPSNAEFWYFALSQMGVAAGASYALRGVYFATIAESGISRSMTGSAAGMISFVGFTPDIFWALWGGWLIKSARDDGDVLVGYRRLWMSLAAFALAGLVSALLLRRRVARS